MDKKDKAKETVQPEISVEQLQTENGTLKDRVTELEAIEKTAKQTVADRDTLLTENVGLKQRVADLEAEVAEATAEANKWENEFNDVFKKLTEENNDLAAKLAELSEESDSSSLRKEDKDGNVKIKFLLSPAGKFLLPYNVGQTVSHPANQADEMVDLKYAEYVK